MQNDLLKLAASHIDLEWVKKHSINLNRLERTTANDDFAASTEYVLKLMEEAGFSEIERYALPCDGETTYDDCTMPLAWDRTGRSTLEIVSPGYELIADSAVEPIHAVIWSPPTPPAGITAELISLRSIHSEDRHEAAGKVILWDNSPTPAEKLKLTQAGALGIVSFVDSIYDTNPDDIRWANGSGLRGWYYTAADKQLWVFSITPRKGRELEERLAAGEKITVKALMNTRVYKGEVFTVTGLIPGKSKEEIALLAHMYEPFLPDDAAGTVLTIAAGKALKALADGGSIPPLEKGLRVVFSMERYGFSEFFLNPGRKEKIISAVNMDSINHSTLKQAGIPAELRSSPASAPHFDTILMANLFSEGFPELAFVKTPGNLSDDTFMADSTFNVPCSWFFTPFVPGRHHNTGAIFDEPDWEMGIAITAAVTACHAKMNAAAAGVGTKELLEEIIAGVTSEAKEDFRRLETSNAAPWDKAVIGKFLVEYRTRQITVFNTLKANSVNAEAITSQLESLRAQYAPGSFTEGETPRSPLTGLVAARKAGFSQTMSYAKVPVPERYTPLTQPEMLLCALLNGRRTLHEAYVISNFILKRDPRPGEAEKIEETIKFLAQYGYYTITEY